MKKIIEHLKMMDKLDKTILVFSVVIFVLLIVNAILTINHAHAFTERQEAGNARWLQVEERIEEYEHKIELLEKDIENVQLKLDKGGQ